MKLTIDTTKDSRDTIRKAIELLQHTLGETQQAGQDQQPYQDIFGGKQEPAKEANVFTAMFSSPDHVVDNVLAADKTEEQKKTVEDRENKVTKELMDQVIIYDL